MKTPRFYCYILAAICIILVCAAPVVASNGLCPDNNLTHVRGAGHITGNLTTTAPLKPMLIHKELMGGKLTGKHSFLRTKNNSTAAMPGENNGPALKSGKTGTVRARFPGVTMNGSQQKWVNCTIGKQPLRKGNATAVHTGPLFERGTQYLNEQAIERNISMLKFTV